MFEKYKIKRKVVKANKAVYDSGLVILTWGNVSAIGKNKESIFIKPSGVPFEKLTPFKISEVSLNEGSRLSGLKPSVDTDIHLEIYRHFNEVGAVIHTHSSYATAFAQARLPIPYLGTTHADYFYGDIPITGDLNKEEIMYDYEKNIGKKIVGHFLQNNINPYQNPAVLIPGHGSVVWGPSVEKALENAVVLEEVAKLAYKTLNLVERCGKINLQNLDLLDKHFLRKHGDKKYYGQ